MNLIACTTRGYKRSFYAQLTRQSGILRIGQIETLQTHLLIKPAVGGSESIPIDTPPGGGKQYLKSGFRQVHPLCIHPLIEIDHRLQ